MRVNSKAEVMTCLQQNYAALQGLGVARCGLFGSFQREQMTERSDVDLLVCFVPGMKTFDNFMDLCFLLEELMGRKVDVLTPESLSPFFGERILNEVEYVSLS